MEYLIDELGVDPLAKDTMGMTTVHVATQNQMFDAVKVIFYYQLSLPVKSR